MYVEYRKSCDGSKIQCRGILDTSVFRFPKIKKVVLRNGVSMAQTYEPILIN